MKNSTKNTQTTKVENKIESIDLSKIEIKNESNIDNKFLLSTIEILSIERGKENENFPFIGVNEIANYLNENNSNFSLLPIDVRRKLQKIRKSEGEYYKLFEGKKNGFVILNELNNKNQFDLPIVIQWQNKNDLKKGIFYSISKIAKNEKEKIDKLLRSIYLK